MLFTSNEDRLSKQQLKGKCFFNKFKKCSNSSNENQIPSEIRSPNIIENFLDIVLLLNCTQTRNLREREREFRWLVELLVGQRVWTFQEPLNSVNRTRKVKFDKLETWWSLDFWEETNLLLVRYSFQESRKDDSRWSMVAQAKKWRQSAKGTRH